MPELLPTGPEQMGREFDAEGNTITTSVEAEPGEPGVLKPEFVDFDEYGQIKAEAEESNDNYQKRIQETMSANEQVEDDEPDDGQQTEETLRALRDRLKNAPSFES
jgi:hypothetical protein